MTLSELQDALLFVGADPGRDSRAFVARSTGRVVWVSNGLDTGEPVPDDLEDPAAWAEVPHPHDLDLGQALAHAFLNRHDALWAEEAARALRRRRGWRRFRSLAEEAGRLDAWHGWERERTGEALRA